VGVSREIKALPIRRKPVILGLEIPHIKNLKYLAIDEISVRKGHRYVNLVMNLETGAVIFIGDGKGADALITFWKRLGKSRCGKTKRWRRT
jgi:hypothetical protein